MKCFNCNKYISEISTICPYCKSPIEKEKAPIDFGDINNTEYKTNNLGINVYMMNPKNKITLIGIITLVIFIIAILGSLILFMFTNKKEPDYQIFLNVLDKVSEYLEDNYIGSKSQASGEYRISLTINGEKTGFTGEYSYDIKNKIVNLTGEMKDPREATGEILIDTQDLNFNFYLEDNNLYFQSEEIYEGEFIYFPIDDASGLLSTKKYDIYSLVMGPMESLKETLKKMNYETTTTTINYLGREIAVTKRSLVLDNKAKLAFIKTLLTNLKEDSNFINEIARTQNKTNDEIINILDNYITKAEYKYSGDSPYKTTVSIYFIKSQIYRIEVLKEEEETNKYTLEIGNAKYYFDYFKDNKNIYSASFASAIKELDTFTQKTYDITFDSDKYVTDISLYLEEVKQPKVKKMQIEYYKNIKELTIEEYESIKGNINYYLNDVSFVDKIQEIYKEKCTPDLKCTCNIEGECNCTYNDKIIKCPINLVMAN